MKLLKALPLIVALALAPAGALHAKDKPAIKTTSGKSLAGLTNIVVASFGVAFVTEKTDAAFVGARNIGKANGMIFKAKLAGLSPAAFQAITDAAYADFVARLGAAGITVGDRAAMVADKQMAKVQYLASGVEGSLKFGKDSDATAMFYGPTAFGPTPLLKGETGGATGYAGKMANSGMFGALSAFSAMGGPAMAKTYYSIYSGQPSISVLYVIDFADAERYGGRHAFEAFVELTASLAVKETLSTVTAVNAKGAAATLTFAEPVAVAGKFGGMADSTTTGQTAGNMAGALIGGLFGSGSNAYKHVLFTADPGAYRTGAITAATNSNALVVAELVAQR